MKLVYCPVPFCEEPKYYRNGRYRGYCKAHISERTRYKIKAYRELLPLWSFRRCEVHGLLNFDQVYRNICVKSPSQYTCKYCRKSYEKSKYCPIKAKKTYEKRYAQKRDRELRHAYGITREDYFKILEAQGGVCAICLISFDEFVSKKRKYKRKYFDIDHCHATKVVRGVLCHSCNMAIGLLKDSSDNLGRAIDYLRPHQ